MSNKTISINPSLFNIGGSLTKTKKKDKKSKNNVTPLISPNILKNKLLKRIKEHKIKETENLENNSKKMNPSNNTHLNDKKDIQTYTDEFNESLNYLQTLTKEKKNNEDKLNYEKMKQKKREELEKKTLKNYESLETASSMPYVNIDLPDELQYQPMINVTTEPLNIDTNSSITIKKPPLKDDVPYGILKGGTKPTYRNWNKTQKNTTNNATTITIENSNQISKETSIRENRLNILKQKIKQKKVESENSNTENRLSNNITTISQKRNNANIDEILMTKNLIQKPNLDRDHNIGININNVSKMDEININPVNTNQSNQAFRKKKIIKKTIRKKYILGKLKNKNTVAVLLKDRDTRKKILSAHKDIKQKSINDIKSYLRDHNLIKIGSNAPNDVIRKLYESSMLAGEITNSNTEILLHNLLKNDKEL
jgi:hypothetical protein